MATFPRYSPLGHTGSSVEVLAGEHSANARGQAAARKEEQYKCCPQIKAYLVSLSLLPSHDKPVLS